MNVIRLGIDKEELCESIPPNESPQRRRPSFEPNNLSLKRHIIDKE